MLETMPPLMLNTEGQVDKKLVTYLCSNKKSFRLSKENIFAMYMCLKEIV